MEMGHRCLSPWSAHRQCGRTESSTGGILHVRRRQCAVHDAGESAAGSGDKRGTWRRVPLSVYDMIYYERAGGEHGQGNTSAEPRTLRSDAKVRGNPTAARELGCMRLLQPWQRWPLPPAPLVTTSAARNGIRRGVQDRGGAHAPAVGRAGGREGHAAWLAACPSLAVFT